MFQEQFAEDVRTGRKPNTIRLPSKSNPKVGEWRSLRRWSGKPYRSKQVILREVQITNVSPVMIFRDQVVITNGYLLRSLIFAGELDEFARKDGFLDWHHMTTWFAYNHKLPFVGVLISWEVSKLDTWKLTNRVDTHHNKDEELPWCAWAYPPGYNPIDYMMKWCRLLEDMDFMAYGKTEQEACDKLTLPSEFNELPSNE